MRLNHLPLYHSPPNHSPGVLQLTLILHPPLTTNPSNGAQIALNRGSVQIMSFLYP